MKTFFDKKREEKSRGKGGFKPRQGGYSGGGGGGGRFGSGEKKGRNAYGEKNRTRPNSYDAVCAKCDSNCQVPFKPNGKKPVHCSRCFDKFGPSAGKPGEENGRHDSPHSHKSVSGGGNGGGGCDNSEVVKQLKALNEKFDMLLDAIEGAGEDAQI